jgi:hypothetical protein
MSKETGRTVINDVTDKTFAENEAAILSKIEAKKIALAAKLKFSRDEAGRCASLPGARRTMTGTASSGGIVSISSGGWA